jgi:battenin
MNDAGNSLYSSTAQIISKSDDSIPSLENGRDRGLWRDLVGYWVLGMCNNYGYVIMLTAAFDILKELEVNDQKKIQIDENSNRYCNLMSTGAILLANTIPSIIVKFSVPFLPSMIKIRVIVACIAIAVSLVMVAFAETQWVALLGVAFSSMSCELGETSFLAYSANFNK